MSECDQEKCYELLRQYVDLKCEGIKGLLNEKISGIDKATDLAAKAMDKRLDGMNEFRDALKDQNKLFVTKEMHDKVLDDIKFLREEHAKQEGKASQSSVNFAMFIAIAGIFIGIVGIVLAMVLH